MSTPGSLFDLNDFRNWKGLHAIDDETDMLAHALPPELHNWDGLNRIDKETDHHLFEDTTD